MFRHYNLTLRQMDEIDEMIHAEHRESAHVLSHPETYPNGFNLVADYILHRVTTKHSDLDFDTIRNIETHIADLLERPRPAGASRINTPRILARR